MVSGKHSKSDDQSSVVDSNRRGKDYAGSTRDQSIQILHSRATGPEKGVTPLSPSRGSHNMSIVVEIQRFAEVRPSQSAQVLHATAGGPQEGVGPVRSSGGADHVARIVDPFCLARDVAWQGP